jgi:hypothetical protein
MVKYFGLSLLFSFSLQAQTYTGGGLGLKVAIEVENINLMAKDYSRNYQKALKLCESDFKIHSFNDVVQFLLVSKVNPEQPKQEKFERCEVYHEKKSSPAEFPCGHDPESIKSFTYIIHQDAFSDYLQIIHKTKKEDADRLTEQLRLLYAKPSVQK